MATKLQSLTAVWQEFDLTGTQKLLDDLAGQITVRQDESDASRKALIELIRGFKKTNSEETRLTVAPLLKTFQNEIDNLSKRAKAAEKAFFDIYQKFCDIADPVPTLEYCRESMKGLHRLNDLEIENGQLREIVNMTNTEVTRLKMKEKELEQMQEQQREQEAVLDARLEERLEQHRENLQQEYTDKLKVIEEDQLMTLRKLQDAETKAKTAQQLLEEAQTELYELKFKEDDKRSAKADEIDILLTDLERANQRAGAAEREVAQLQERLEEVERRGGGGQEDGEDDVMSVESTEDKALLLQLAAKEREAGQLTEDLIKASRTLQETENRFTVRLVDLERRVRGLEEEKAELELKLTNQQDYQQIKKDLAILKTLEFSTESSGEILEDTRPLEVLILERSKVLQSENSLLRLDKERSNREIQDLRIELEQRIQQCNKQEQLVAQLEDHVEQLQAISTPYREEAEGRSSSDTLAEILHQGDEVFYKESSLSPVPGAAESSGTMLSIVAAQRERLRARNEELETINDQQQEQINLIQNEVKSLTQDNLKLYEKIRFLQSCSGGKPTQDVVVPVESRYKSSYEQRLDPFTSFNQSEKQRKYAQLSVFEKIILSLVRFVASNKNARLAVFFYACMLHGLVFAVLYKLALTDSCRHDQAARWHERYLDHMQEVHGHGPDHDIG